MKEVTCNIPRKIIYPHKLKVQDVLIYEEYVMEIPYKKIFSMLQGYNVTNQKNV
jgi:hypothetical protein